MADFGKTEQEITNVENPEENKVVIADGVLPARIATVNAAGELSVIVTGGGSAGQLVQDAAPVAVPDVGRISVGSDGTNYRFITTDAQGNLQIDVLTNPPILHSIDSIRLGDGTTLTDVISGGGINRLAVETFPSSAAGAEQNVVITDPNTPSQQANVDASGRLQVSTQAPTPPPSTTAVIQSVDGDIGNNAVFNSYYTITNTTTLEIQRFTAAGEGGANNGYFFELYEDPLGTGGATTNPIPGSWVLIELMVIPSTGDSKFVDISNSSFVGNGTRRIVLRAVRLGGGGAKRGFMKFVGFEQ